jgi:hypothetical protein
MILYTGVVLEEKFILRRFTNYATNKNVHSSISEPFFHNHIFWEKQNHFFPCCQ